MKACSRFLVAALALWWLWRIRHEFTGRLQRGSWGLAVAALAVGSVRHRTLFL